MANAEYRIGDEATITGVVTGVGDNGGNPEYTVAVNNPDTERPISVPAQVSPVAYANNQDEVLALNAKRYAEVAKESAAAQKELDKNKDEDQVTGDDTPDPARTPAGNASAAKPAVTVKK